MLLQLQLIFFFSFILRSIEINPKFLWLWCLPRHLFAMFFQILFNILDCLFFWYTLFQSRPQSNTTKVVITASVNTSLVVNIDVPKLTADYVQTKNSSLKNTFYTNQKLLISMVENHILFSRFFFLYIEIKNNDIITKLFSLHLWTLISAYFVLQWL